MGVRYEVANLGAQLNNMLHHTQEKSFMSARGSSKSQIRVSTGTRTPPALGLPSQKAALQVAFLS